MVSDVLERNYLDLDINYDYYSLFSMVPKMEDSNNLFLALWLTICLWREYITNEQM